MFANKYVVRIYIFVVGCLAIYVVRKVVTKQNKLQNAKYVSKNKIIFKLI